MAYEAIIFDFFGVLCSEIAPTWLRWYFQDNKADEVKLGIVHKADLGILSEDQLFSSLGEKAGISASRVKDEWWSLVHIDEDLLALLPVFARQYRLGLLTNSPAPFVRRIMAAHRIENVFETIVVSSEVGMAKPEQAVYKYILDVMGLSAEKAIMVDDNPKNIDAARAVGMGGVLYSTPNRLVRTLPPLPSVQ